MSNSILATPLQLSSSASAQAGLDEQAISLIIHASTHLTLSAALLLKLPHSVGVHASILLQRFFTGSTGGSLRSHDAHHISAGALYLASKLSLTNAASPRDIVNTYTYLRSLEPPFFNPPPNHLDPGEYSVSEGTYQSRRQELFEAELLVLRTLGFQTLAPQPYALAVQYAQALGALEEQKGRAVARRAHAHLNTALVSPQLLFLTQLPHALAVAAVYLAAREEGVKLVDVSGGWWEVFDVEREDLGYIVVAILSVGTWIEAMLENQPSIATDAARLHIKTQNGEGQNGIS